MDYLIDIFIRAIITLHSIVASVGVVCRCFRGNLPLGNSRVLDKVMCVLVRWVPVCTNSETLEPSSTPFLLHHC